MKLNESTVFISFLIENKNDKVQESSLYYLPRKSKGHRHISSAGIPKLSFYFLRVLCLPVLFLLDQLTCTGCEYVQLRTRLAVTTQTPSHTQPTSALETQFQQGTVKTHLVPRYSTSVFIVCISSLKKNLIGPCAGPHCTSVVHLLGLFQWMNSFASSP